MLNITNFDKNVDIKFSAWNTC